MPKYAKICQKGAEGGWGNIPKISQGKKTPLGGFSPWDLVYSSPLYPKFWYVVWFIGFGVFKTAPPVRG
jgi:hypothetical protein